MATGLLLQNEEGMSPGKNLRKQLAVAVTSIQWSYAIFWSISPTEPGVLVWGEGYYNGDIKTRKTIQAMELDDDLIGLQRSDQLKELYESLLAGESSNPQSGNNRRPSASLSPEDLSDTEWFYLVCMSFVFNPGQGLPGRSLANNRPIWLCNAHYADSKVFSRSLLAKSASIQTVVCFPLSGGGVVELGVAEQVSEDLSLIQRVKASLLQDPNPALSGTPPHSITQQLSDEILNAATHTPLLLGEEIHYDSPNNSSSEFRPMNQPPGDGYIFVDLESINNADACQAAAAQSRRLLTDDQELSNGLFRASLTSGECISQAFVDHRENHPRPTSPIPKSVNQRGGLQDWYEVMEEEGEAADLEESEDSHYQSVLSSLFKSSHQSVLGPSDHQKCTNRAVSCFISWRRSGTPATGRKVAGSGMPQKLLKKILFEVPRMHSEHVVESGEEEEDIVVPGKDEYDKLRKPEAGDEAAAATILYDGGIVPGRRKKKGKVNERFSTLKSLIPATSKQVGKVSILDETISYVEELESRVRELESCRKLAEYEATRRKPAQDTAERSCDNNYVGGGGRGVGTKRKASSCSIGYEGEGRKKGGVGHSVPAASVKEEGRDKISIGMSEQDMLIEVRCPWREGLLFEIIEVVSNLSLDSHTVQSSTVEAHLSVTIKSKVRGLDDLSVGMVRRALRKVVEKS